MFGKKINDVFNLIISVSGIIFLFLYPANCIEAAKDGLTTALYIVLPSIFPFMVLSKFIIAGNLHYPISYVIGKPFKFLFGMDKKYAVVFVLGCIGGYPLGAIAVNDLLKNNEISVCDAEHMIGYCNNAGPMFIIGTVGTLLLKNTMYGYVLYVIHIVSAVIGGFIMRIFCKPHRSNSNLNLRKNKDTSPFSVSVSSSVTAMINIVGYIIIFSVISSFITKTLANSSSLILSSVLCFFEITTGIKFTAEHIFSEALKIAIISAALGFSGICVFSQSKAVFENTNISFKKYICTKLIIALISFTIAYIVFTIIFSN